MEAAAGAFLALGILVSMSVPTQNVRYYLPLAVPMAIVSALAGCAVLMRRHEFTIRDKSVSAFDNMSTPRADASGTMAPAAEEDSKVGSVVTYTTAERRRVEWILRGMLLAALVHWAAFTFAVMPHRAADDSLRPAAEAFGRHIPSGATIYADVGDSFSSLFFYLDRPVQDTGIFDDPIPPGCFFVLRADQLSALDIRKDLSYTVVERAPSESDELLLARIRSPE
jgi:hypothetical protein